MKTNTILAIVAGAVLVAGSFALFSSNGTLVAATAQPSDPSPPGEDEAESKFLVQVDIDQKFEEFGKAGFFKLLVDVTEEYIDSGHVAISNIRCDKDGDSTMGIVIANARTAAEGGTLGPDVVPLDSSLMVTGVSSPGSACTYHYKIEQENHNFYVTDVALANLDDDDTTPKRTASAVLMLETLEQDEFPIDFQNPTIEAE